MISMDDEALLLENIGDEALSTLRDEIELLDGASAEFDIGEVRRGKLTPVFLGQRSRISVWRYFCRTF